MSKISSFYYKNNRLQQIRGFINVVQYGGITKAAEQMNLTQSAVSCQIATLEKDLKLKLFKKVGTKLILTAKGERFYNMSVSYVYGMENLFENFITEENETERNNVRIAGHQYALSHLLPKYYSEMIAIEPNVKFEIFNTNEQDGISKLNNGEVDLVIFPFEQPRNDVYQKSLHVLDTVLVLPINHELVNVPEKEISWNDLVKYDFLHLGDATVKSWHSVIKNYGLKSRFSLNDCNWEILKGTFHNSNCIALADRFYVQNEENVVFKNANHLLPSRISFDICVKLPHQTTKTVAQKLIKLAIHDYFDELTTNP